MIAEPMSTGSTSGGYGTITASDLVAMEFAPARFVVPGLIGEGLTLLAGPPKIGKSMLMLHVAIAVATGGTALGSIPCKPANVCYVALEDGKRRVQGRLHNMIGSDPVPDRLSFKFECRRLDQGGFEELRSVCQARDVKLLIIDVLAAFRPPQGRRNYYEWDFRSLHELQQLATELGIAVVVVHHTRKASANDPLDRVSGTTGLTGAADTVTTLGRQRASDYVLEGEAATSRRSSGP